MTIVGPQPREGEKRGLIMCKKWKEHDKWFRQQVLGEVSRWYRDPQVMLWDRWYVVPKLVKWGELIRDVLFGMPKYTTEVWDCENFAMLTAARMGERFKVNSCGLVIAKMPAGWHGLNCIISSDYGLYFLEPQTGEVKYPADFKGRPTLFIFG